VEQAILKSIPNLEEEKLMPHIVKPYYEYYLEWRYATHFFQQVNQALQTIFPEYNGNFVLTYENIPLVMSEGDPSSYTYEMVLVKTQDSKILADVQQIMAYFESPNYFHKRVAIYRFKTILDNLFTPITHLDQDFFQSMDEEDGLPPYEELHDNYYN